MEAVSDGAHGAGAPPRLDHGLALVDRSGEWFLDIDVEATLEAGQRRLGVEVVGEADDGRIDIAGREQLAEVREHGRRRRGRGQASRGVASAGVGLGDGDQLHLVRAREDRQMGALRDPPAAE